jgi:hypothetical protein
MGISGGFEGGGRLKSLLIGRNSLDFLRQTMIN